MTGSSRLFLEDFDPFPQYLLTVTAEILKYEKIQLFIG